MLLSLKPAKPPLPLLLCSHIASAATFGPSGQQGMVSLGLCDVSISSESVQECLLVIGFFLDSLRTSASKKLEFHLRRPIYSLQLILLVVVTNSFLVWEGYPWRLSGDMNVPRNENFPSFFWNRQINTGILRNMSNLLVRHT